MSAIALGRFLARRMATAGVDPAGSLTVEDVRARMVPYRSCRGELDLATKAEYDLALLALLNEPELVEVMDEGLRKAIERELASPEPQLAVLDGYGASRVGLGPALGGRRREGAARAPADVASPAPAEAEKTPAEAERAAGEAERAAAEPEAAPPEPEAEGAQDACAACGAELPRNREVRFCPYCGADQDVPRCEACGEELEAEWRYCPACGRAADT